MAEVGDLIDELLGFSTQVFLLMLAYWLVAKCGAREQRLDLACQGVTIDRDVCDRGEIIGINPVASRDRSIGEIETIKPKGAKGGVELLVGPRQRKKMLLILPQAVRASAFLDCFDEHTSIMDVGVCQSKEGEHRRTHIGVIGEDRVVPSQASHPGTDHRQPGSGDVLLEI